MSESLPFRKALFFFTLKILLKLDRKADVNGVEPRNNTAIQTNPQEAFFDEIFPTSPITRSLISGNKREVIS